MLVKPQNPNRLVVPTRFSRQEGISLKILGTTWGESAGTVIIIIETIPYITNITLLKPLAPLSLKNKLLQLRMRQDGADISFRAAIIVVVMTLFYDQKSVGWCDCVYISLPPYLLRSWTNLVKEFSYLLVWKSYM